MKKTKLNIGSYHDSSLGEIAYDLFWEKYSVKKKPMK